jgi:hypothetical protein
MKIRLTPIKPVEEELV